MEGAIFSGGLNQTQLILIPDDELNSKIRSLNTKQREMFDLVHDWAKKNCKKFINLKTNHN